MPIGIDYKFYLKNVDFIGSLGNPLARSITGNCRRQSPAPQTGELADPQHLHVYIGKLRVKWGVTWVRREFGLRHVKIEV